ncbi:hypothetical protein WI665_17915, partial [Vibrio cholerae]
LYFVRFIKFGCLAQTWYGWVTVFAFIVKRFRVFVRRFSGQAKDLTASFVLEKQLKAPLKKGDIVGTLYYQLAGNDIAQYPLLALEDVQEGSLFSRLWDYLVLLFKSWF